MSKLPLFSIGLLLLNLLVVTPADSLGLPSAEVKCLADTIYYEARGEPVEGQIAVANVVFNRVKDNRWPDSVCGVVYEDKQFSWTALPDKQIKDTSTYSSIYDRALKLWLWQPVKAREEANHYLRCDYRDKVSWWKSMDFKGQIGSHCFYKG